MSEKEAQNPQTEELPLPLEEPGDIPKVEHKRYPIKAYLGIITIAKREFFANLKSVV